MNNDETQNTNDPQISSKKTISNQLNTEKLIAETIITKSSEIETSDKNRSTYKPPRSTKSNIISTTEKNTNKTTKSLDYLGEESKTNQNKFPHFSYSTNPTDVYKSIIHINSNTSREDDTVNDVKMTHTSKENSRENFQEVIQNSVLHLGLHSLWEKR